MEKPDRFIDCTWTCKACKDKGTMRIWQYVNETPAQTAIRETQRTRGACVQGCGFIAEPTQ